MGWRSPSGVFSGRKPRMIDVSFAPVLLFSLQVQFAGAIESTSHSCVQSVIHWTLSSIWLQAFQSPVLLIWSFFLLSPWIIDNDILSRFFDVTYVWEPVETLSLWKLTNFSIPTYWLVPSALYSLTRFRLGSHGTLDGITSKVQHVCLTVLQLEPNKNRN